MVSVVIPTVNSSAFLRDTLNSVAAQTFKPSEIIIVDGGSTDETLTIASEFDVRFAPERSRGIANGRNIGIKLARSEWIALLDHDDVWEPNKLEKQINAIRECPDIAMVLTDFTSFNELGMEQLSCLDQSGYFTFADFTDRPWIVPLTSSCLLKKGTEWFDEDLQGTDDAEFFLRMMTHPFVILKEPLTKWRKSVSNFSRNGLAMEIDFAKVMDKIIESPEKYPKGVYECVYKIRSHRLLKTSYHLLRNGQPLKSFSFLRKSYASSR